MLSLKTVNPVNDITRPTPNPIARFPTGYNIQLPPSHFHVDVVVHLAAALAALEACETSAARVGISHSLPSFDGQK